MAHDIISLTLGSFSPKEVTQTTETKTKPQTPHGLPEILVELNTQNSQFTATKRGTVFGVVTHVLGCPAGREVALRFGEHHWKPSEVCEP